MINILIPMAGEGSRFKNTHSLPKPLISINDKPMIVRAIESLGITGKYHFVIRNNEFMQQTIGAIYSTCPDPNIVSVNYTPNGQFNTFENGMPTQINITLQFKELALLTKDKVKEGL